LNILVVGAHPDDIELGCFGTLGIHYLAGDKIFGTMITNGELEGKPKIRQKETEKSAKLINMKIFFGNFPDGDVKENYELVTFLDDIIEKNKIDVMYTHTINDRHQDHRAIAKASISAARNVKELYSFESPSVIYPFNPQLFIDITSTFEIKTSALKIHKTQKRKPYTRIEAAEGIAKFRAYQSGIPNRLCEAFEVQKILRNNVHER